jgi:uncharacterized membrane protein YfcA
VTSLLTLSVDGRSVSTIALLVLGVVVGYLAGMFGVGGGFLLTPLLTVVLGVPLPIAIGSGLCQVVGTAVTAYLRHRRIGQGEVRFDLLALAGSLLGVDAGARALAALSDAGGVMLRGHNVSWVSLAVEGLYIVLLVAVAAMFWRQGEIRTDVHGEHAEGPLARIHFGPRIRLPMVNQHTSVLLAAYIGFGLGFLSGLLGIGGGVALMPVLIYGYGFPIRQAAGTGIVLLAATASVGTFVHALRGHVHLGLASLLLIGSTVSAQFGALATHRWPAHRLRRTFALVVMLTVAAVAWDLVRRIA